MHFLLYDYVDANGVNEFRDWSKRLQTDQRAKLNQKLDALQRMGEALLPVTLTGTSVGGLFKLRIQGNVKLRPLLCRGPLPDEAAFTLLAGAKEIGSVLKPDGIEFTADNRKAAVIKDPATRRTVHERIAK